MPPLANAPTIVSATLKVESGPRAGKAITLRAGETRGVGRSVSTDLSIPHDASLSGVHFSIECTPAAARVRSLDGVLTVNGRKVAEARLADGDRIAAGQTTFLVRLELRHAPEEAVPLTLTSSRPTRPYQAAIRDPDPALRREALIAAAWARQPWLLDHLRASSDACTPERWPEIWLLAVLGSEDDRARVLRAAETLELGPRRLALLGTFGSPAGVDVLLREMRNPDPLTAVVAGAAFSRITGVSVDSAQRVALVPPEAGEDHLAHEFADEVSLPDPERAQAHWSTVQKDFGRDGRWCRGIDVSREVDEEALRAFDLESRDEHALRCRFRGASSEGPLELRRFRSGATATIRASSTAKSVSERESHGRAR
jgi:predicted component of type VI protein secretion system